MNILNESYDDGRKPSRGARAAILLLAIVVLAGAGALGVHRANRQAGQDYKTEGVPPQDSPDFPADLDMIATAWPQGTKLALTPVRDEGLRDEQFKDAVADKPKIAAGEQLKDAVGDFRLLQPGDAKLPNTTITQSDVVRTYRWTGLYAGVNLGGSKGVSALRTSVEAPGDYFTRQDISQIGDLGSVDSSPTGFTGGVQVGYNYQHESIVMGLEADLNALQLSDTQKQTGSYNSSPATKFAISQSIHTDWLVTVRPRLGVVLDRLLVYGTGGVALTQFKYDEEYTDTFGVGHRKTESFSETRLGWTIGGGVEYALRENWSLKGEYLYADFGKLSETSALVVAVNGGADHFNHSATFNVHLVRLGLNYRF
jgi:outer membrane immunogenic protein